MSFNLIKQVSENSLPEGARKAIVLLLNLVEEIKRENEELREKVHIAKTKAKKSQLLTVLSHPQIPLHNNPAELAARQRVRKRDISFGPRSPDGVASWDTFMSLAATAKKLGISFFAYIYDRISGSYALPSLADTIYFRSLAFQPTTFY